MKNLTGCWYVLFPCCKRCTKKIIKSFLLLSFILTIHGIAYAFQLTLAWDPNHEPDLAGYKVHYGKLSRNYEFSVDVGKNESVVISGLVMGKTYYFAVTAYDVDMNESDFSMEIPYKVPGFKTKPWIPLLLLDD